MNGRYILRDKVPVAVDDLMLWAMAFEKMDRRVALTVGDNGVRMSTVFLGLDHSFGFSGGPPLLFETMIFGGEHDEYCDRYSTWAEAEVGHEKARKLAGI